MTSTTFPSVTQVQRIPRVSVIVTVYRRTQFLAEALNSVFAQSYTDWELIVADDSGTGAARPIVEDYARDTRIRYASQPTSVGVARSLVHAVRHARGELIAILNDDDVWERDLLARLVPPLDADPGRVLATADHWIMDSAGNVNHAQSEAWTTSFGRDSLGEGDVDSPVEFAINGAPAINIASVFRKEAIDWSLLVPDVAGSYDYWIGCLLAATHGTIYYVPRRLARWRTHAEMATLHHSHDKAENLVYIYSTLRGRRWFPDHDAALKRRLTEALFAAGRDKLHFDRAPEARRYFWRSFLLSGDLRALMRVIVSLLPRQVRSPLGAGFAAMRRVQQPPTNEQPVSARNPR